MNKAVKGALWSGLVLPGLGQMILKHYLRGALFLLGSMVCLTILVVRAVAQAAAIIENLDLVNAAIDPGALLAEVNQVVQASSDSTGLVVSWLLLVLWVSGAVDAYLLGRKQDRQVGAGQTLTPDL